MLDEVLVFFFNIAINGNPFRAIWTSAKRTSGMFCRPFPALAMQGCVKHSPSHYLDTGANKGMPFIFGENWAMPVKLKANTSLSWPWLAGPAGLAPRRDRPSDAEPQIQFRAIIILLARPCERRSISWSQLWTRCPSARIVTRKSTSVSKPGWRSIYRNIKEIA